MIDSMLTYLKRNKQEKILNKEFLNKSMKKFIKLKWISEERGATEKNMKNALNKSQEMKFFNFKKKLTKSVEQGNRNIELCRVLSSGI